MPVAVLDSPSWIESSSGDPGAVSAGSDRVAILIGCAGNFANATINSSAASYGGQAMSLIIQASPTNARVGVSGWLLNEAGIALMSGSTASFSADGSGKSFYMVTFSGVDQDTPTEGTGSDGGASTDTFTLSGLAKTADGYRFAALGGRAIDLSSSAENPPILSSAGDESFSQNAPALLQGETVSTTGTEDTTITLGGSNYHAYIGFSLKPAGAAAAPTNFLTLLGVG